MIKVIGRELQIPQSERKLGFESDNLVEIRKFYITDKDLFDLSFKLDVAEYGCAVDLEKSIVLDGSALVLTWTITSSITQNSGRINVQLRAFDTESTLVWHSQTQTFFVGEAVNASKSVENVALTEFEQIEIRATAAKEEAQKQVLLAQGYAQECKVNLEEHKDDNSNPHNVTASQVGAYTTTEVDGMFAEQVGKKTDARGGEIFNHYTRNQATGNYSHAEGLGTTASGYVAHTEGYFTEATKDFTHAEGDKTKALGYGTHAEGSDTEAVGDCAHAEGNNTVASGSNCHAEGLGAIASGYISHAEGHETEAGGEKSHAEGVKTKALGYGTHAEGSDTEAVGDCAHAEGYQTKVYGNYSHAEGQNCYAGSFNPNSSKIGSCTHAEGQDTIASGSWSHAEGHGSNANGDCQHVEGRYNISDNENKYAHIVGNGESDTNRSNAHTLDWDGNAWFAGDVTVTTANGEVTLGEKINALFNMADGIPKYTYREIDEEDSDYNDNIYCYESAGYAHAPFDFGVVFTDYAILGGSALFQEEYIQLGISLDKDTCGQKYKRVVTQGSDWTQVDWVPVSTILTSPNGTKYELTVDDSGVLSVKEV